MFLIDKRPSIPTPSRNAAFRQDHPEGGSTADLRLHIHSSAVRGQDRAAIRQPETVAPAGTLRREERLEEPVQDLGCHAAR
jgi:hypothetical protein